MDFGHDATTLDLVARMRAFLDEEIIPAEVLLEQQLAADPNSWSPPPIVRELQASARRRGLWNLFLELDAVQYAPIAELTGWSPRLAPAAINGSPPDSGNIELLRDFGSPADRERWLGPLMSAEIRSSFCMTEPDVASSDATNISTAIRRDGDDYVIDGRKWWSSGIMNPEAQLLIVMGKTDPGAERHRQQSMILVPRDTPGVTIVRPLSVFGYWAREAGGHGEVRFDGVRVPATNLLIGEGEGFAIAQARLGPGRIHHCMRAIGMGERAIDLMRTRANERVAFGRPLAEQGVIREWMAQSRIDLETARLLVLKAAWLMDTVGNREAHTEIQAIKIAVPRQVEAVLERAIQLFGGAGFSQDTPLAELYSIVRTLRMVDGPDEVHLRSLGRDELRRSSPSPR